MKWHFLYKLVNLLSQREYYGIHLSEDMDFGTTAAFDDFIPNISDLKEDIRKHGVGIIRITPIHCFIDPAEANRHLQRHIAEAAPNNYNNEITLKRSNALKGKQNRLGVKVTDETKTLMSLAKSKENNPFYGKKHSTDTLSVLSQHRKGIRWVNNGTEERQVGKDDPIPEGFQPGRKARTLKDTTSNT